MWISGPHFGQMMETFKHPMVSSNLDIPGMTWWLCRLCKGRQRADRRNAQKSFRSVNRIPERLFPSKLLLKHCRDRACDLTFCNRGICRWLDKTSFGSSKVQLPQIFLVLCPSIQYREKISTVLDEGNAVKDFVVLVKRELGCGNS